MEIKNRKGDVIYTSEKNNIKDALMEAIKFGADLRGADLSGADLRDAYLGGAYLRCTDLRCTDLRGADLSGAFLKDADLNGAYLSGAFLNGADLRGAFLNGAYLKCTDLNGADLSGADLNGAYLNGAHNVPYIPLVCPSDGSFVAWKKVKGLLVKLLIPEDAKRSSATTKKCRCDKAIVMEITSIEGDKRYNKVVNKSYEETVYEVGKEVLPDEFDENRWKECSHGIHFFINKQDAINH